MSVKAAFFGTLGRDAEAPLYWREEVRLPTGLKLVTRCVGFANRVFHRVIPRRSSIAASPIVYAGCSSQ
jgi:hypothetical protein